MAKSVSYGIEFLFSGGNSDKALKGISSASKGLEKDIDRLRKQEALYEKAEKSLEKQLSGGNITRKEFLTLQKRQAKAYQKATGDSTKLAKIYERERQALKRRNDEQKRGSKLGGLVSGGLSSRAGALGALGPAGVAAGLGVGAVAGLASFSERQYQYQKQLEKQASLLGLTAVELEGVSNAMSKLGATSKDDAIEGLKDIRERIGEIADDANGSLGKAARAIGLDAQRLRGMDVSGQINEIVESLGRLDTETRLFRSRELFGDSAANMLTGAAGNTSEFNRLKEAGEKNAVLFDDKTMQSMKEFGETVGELKASLSQSLLPAAKMLAEAAGNVAQGEQSLKSISDKEKRIRELEEEALSSGYSLPAAPRGMPVGMGRSASEMTLNLGKDGFNRDRVGDNKTFKPRGFGEGYEGYFDDIFGSGLKNKAYDSELNQRLNTLNVLLGKSDDEGSASSAKDSGTPSAGSGSSTSPSKFDDSMKFYREAEQARKLAEHKKVWEGVYRKEQPNRSDAQLSRMAEMEMQFTEERKGVTGFRPLKLLKEYQREYFDLEIKRMEGLEEAKKAEEDRLKVLREQQGLAKKQFGKSSMAINAREQAKLNMLDRGDDKISKQADVLRARAEGSSLRGQNSFKAGSVEEFQFISAMQRENEVQSTLNKIDQREEQRHAEIAALRQKAIDEATQERETLRNELSAKLDYIASAINSKE